MVTGHIETRRPNGKDSHTVGWVKGPQRIRGLDPLGVRAPCESLYTQLLPGITNVTDRARYFSFYPWLIWAVDQHDGPLKEKPLHHTVRRADCLFTLIAARHQATAGIVRHGHGGLIGAITLFRALPHVAEGDSLRLSEFATTDAVPERYFKNKLGGLGQYYLGALQQADLLRGDMRSGIRYTDERGAVLAEAFDGGVDRGAFFAALEADEITTDTLEELAPFCACSLHENEAEHTALADYFFNREGDFRQESGLPRRLTLNLLLDLCARLQGADTAVTIDGGGADVFRACAYAGALPGGEAWALGHEALETQRRGWHMYHRHELFSVALQGIFWAGLGELQDQGVRLADSRAYGEWFVEAFEGGFDGRAGEPFAEAVTRVAGELPPLELWEESSHEVQLGWQVHNLTRAGDAVERREEVLRTCLGILLALAARHADVAGEGSPYGLSPYHLKQYPINLYVFEQQAAGDWGRLPMRDVVERIAARWGVDAHLRVALRKLRGDAHDTFKIMPTEQGLLVTEGPLPGFTAPRLRQALQVLYDLRAIDLDPDAGGMTTTDFGSRMLKECRDE